VTRIIAGAGKGRSLLVPRGGATRPTADKVREALFSRLEHGGWLEGTRVLDLYAGTGALGLEAASRGAAEVLLVERAPAAVDACRRNAAALASTGVDGVSVRAASVSSVLAGGTGVRYDLVLLDPPYDAGEQALAGVLAALVGGWLADDALVVLERGARSPRPTWPPGLEAEEERRYGETALWFARTTPLAPAERP
jgi:16S rRNA (guanine966-N2)-methyltransferase